LLFDKLAKSKDCIEWCAQFVAHAKEKLALGPVRPLSFFFRLAQLVFGMFALGGVANRGHGQDSLISFERAEADLDWKLGSVLAPSCQVEPGAHRSGARVLEKNRPDDV